MSARSAIVAVVLTTTSVLFAAKPSAPPSPPPAATILCYHIVESPNDTKFSLSRETYRQQMEYLASAGYNVVPLAHVSEYIRGKRKSLPPNAVVITIDDGWKCTYTEIYPEMKRHRFPFTVFIYPKFIGMSAYALTWKEVREMANGGVDIQSHSYSHPFLTQRRHRSLGEDRYAEWLNRELTESKKTIERETGKSVRYLAYPYGDYDSRVVAAAEQSGYEAAVTAEFGSVSKVSDPFRLRRVVIDTSMSFAEFRRLLGNGPLRVEDPTPSAGSLFTPQHPVIAARLRDFKSLDPNSVGISIVGLGSVPFSYNPDDGTISTVVRDPLPGNKQHVVVWGRDAKTGKRLESSWTFYAHELPKKKLPLPAAVEPAATTAASATPAVDPAGARAVEQKRK